MRVPTFLLFTVTVLYCISILSPYVQCDSDDPDVVVLTDKNFDEFIKQDLVLVEFYAPWCGHCKNLAPEYAKAATRLLPLGVPIGKLDATVHNEVAGRYSVSGYPTLKVFRNGKASEYQGGRTADTIVSYMQKQIGPAAKPLKTKEEIDAFIVSDKDTKYAVVIFVNSTPGKKVAQLSSSFALLAPRLRDDYIFGKVSSENVASLLKSYVPDADVDEGLVVFLNGEATLYKGSPKTSTVENWIRSRSTPLVGRSTEKTMATYHKRKIPLGKFYMKVDKKWNSKHMKYYRNRLEKVAAKFEGKIAIAIVNKDSFNQEVEANGFKNDDFGFMIEDGAKEKKYQYTPPDNDGGDKDNAAINVDALTTFIQSWIDGKAKVYIKSEKTPVPNDGPVTVVTGQNFDEIVNDEDVDLFIEFYAPWCGHCKQLEPKWKQLGEHFHKKKNIVIAKIDATANDYDRETFKVEGFPTIFFRAAGDDSPRKYDGGRELDELIDYVNDNAKTLRKKKSKKNKKQKKKKNSEHEEL